MYRQALTDGSGRWFNLERARYYNEDTYWNGNNHISRATGTQWDHAELYCTESRRYILHSWSQWQGSVESWTEITPEKAAAWLVENGHEESEPALAEQVAALEMA